MGNYLLVKGYANIADGDLTIARTNGLQAALDAKAGSTSLINLKPIVF